MTELTLRQKIEDALNALKEDSSLFKKFKGDNAGPFLAALYFWQSVGKIAEKAEAVAWKAAVAGKMLLPDDDLREALSKGEEHILLESKQFSLVAEVKSPQQRFDLDKFIGRIAKKYKLDAVALTEIAADCKTPGTPPLSKRVMSAG